MDVLNFIIGLFYGKEETFYPEGTTNVKLEYIRKLLNQEGDSQQRCLEREMIQDEFHDIDKWTINRFVDVMRIKLFYHDYAFLFADGTLMKEGITRYGIDSCGDRVTDEFIYNYTLVSGTEHRWHLFGYNDDQIEVLKKIGRAFMKFASVKRQFDQSYNMIKFCRDRGIIPTLRVVSDELHVIEAKFGNETLSNNVTAIENSQMFLDYYIEHIRYGLDASSPAKELSYKKKEEETPPLAIESPPFDDRELSSFLETFSEPQNLLPFLKSILVNHELMVKNASLSESHRLGFDKIIIISNNSYRVHLHIWWENSKVKDGIHNHKFNFVSKILKGCLTDNLYERADDSNSQSTETEWIRESHEYLALPANQNTTDRFLYKGISKIRRYAQKYRKAGTMYKMHHQTFHASYPTNPDELTMTLFVRTLNVKDADTIFEKVPFESQKNDDANVSVDNKKISAEQYHDTLVKVIKILES
jgi:hypothetical protein